MRSAFTCAIVLAAILAAGAAHGQDRGLSGWDAIRFGMSEQEVVAATPGVSWRRQAFGSSLVILRGPGAFPVGGIDLAPSVAIRYDRVEKLTLAAFGRVATAEQCASVLERIVVGLEETIGVFDGAPAPWEFGEQRGLRRTEAGSELRFYGEGGRQSGHANWRGNAFADAKAAFEPNHERLNAPGCEIEVTLSERPLPVFTSVQPPTAEQLANAELIRAPEWDQEPDSVDYERSLPDSEYNGRIDVALDCLVLDEGYVNCLLSEDESADAYVRQTALNLARYYRLAPALRASSVGKRVRIPIEVTVGSPPSDAVNTAPSNSETLETARALLAEAPTVAELASATLIDHPEWLETPSGDSFVRFYPSAALESRLAGDVELHCLVLADGRLRCAVASESPPGADFGVAALGIAQGFRIASEINGTPTSGGRVRVQLRFRAQTESAE